jgi:hypothetical protein
MVWSDESYRLLAQEKIRQMHHEAQLDRLVAHAAARQIPASGAGANLLRWIRAAFVRRHVLQWLSPTPRGAERQAALQTKEGR